MTVTHIEDRQWREARVKRRLMDMDHRMVIAGGAGTRGLNGNGKKHKKD